MKKSKSFLKTTSAALGVLYCINKVIDSNSIANSSTKSSGKYYHWKHGDIFYKKIGQGDPLLLIHDLTVFSSNYEWSQVAATLSESHTVYLVDLIGCGKSDKPALTYTNYFFVQMITDFITDVIGEKTKVAATGLSSSFILMANTLNENLFSTIFLVSPKSISYLKATPDRNSKILTQLFDLPIIGKTAYYIATSKSNIEYTLTEKCYYNPFTLKQASIKAYYDAAHTCNGSGKSLLASIEGKYVNADITRALKNAQNKIIILNGECASGMKEITAMYTGMNHSILSDTISNSSLLPQLEMPGETANVILKYLNK